MKRLTTDNPKTMVEKSLNQCYVEAGEAWLRDSEEEMSCRDFTRRLLKIHTNADYANSDDDFFDECILDALQYGHTDIEGVIAMYYNALVSNAELREQLKKYEDAEEKGLLVNPPCKVGDTVWTICAGMTVPAEVCMIADKGNGWFVFLSSGKLVSFSDIFLTPEEAQQALKERADK